MKSVLKKSLKRIGLVLLGACVLFLVLDLIGPLKINIPYAQLVEARDGTVLYAYIAKDQQWRMVARLDEITPDLKKAIVFKEDRYYYYHAGINPLAVGRAVLNNIFHLKRTSGASTISMQV